MCVIVVCVYVCAEQWVPLNLMFSVSFSCVIDWYVN